MLRPHKHITVTYLLVKLEAKELLGNSSLPDHIQRCSAQVITSLPTHKVQSSLERVVTDLQIKMPQMITCQEKFVVLLH
jgi:hypothetical protein